MRRAPLLDMTSPLRDRLAGPPLALPPAFDRAAEAWATTEPRVRLIVWAAVAVAVLLVAGSGAARSPWGPSVAAVVAVRDVPVGATLGPADLTTVAWPRALLPDGAIDDPSLIVGQVVTHGVVAGLPLTASTASDDGPARGLAAGRAAFPLAADGISGLEAGQRVDVVGTDPERGGVVLTASARVLAVTGDTVWLDIDRGDAAGLGAAATWGQVHVVVLPG